jgi:hypothetical protein
VLSDLAVAFPSQMEELEARYKPEAPQADDAYVHDEVLRGLSIDALTNLPASAFGDFRVDE